MVTTLCILHELEVSQEEFFAPVLQPARSMKSFNLESFRLYGITHDSSSTTQITKMTILCNKGPHVHYISCMDHRYVIEITIILVQSSVLGYMCLLVVA